MKGIKILVVFSILSLFSACEKVLMLNDLPGTATNTFGYLWQKVDEQYSMFDVKRVDWVAVYDSLRPLVYDGMDNDSLFSVCARMLNVLRDGHVNLYSAYDVSRSDSIYYNFYRESDFDADAVVLNYLGINYHQTGGVAHNSLCDGRVIYARYGSFSSGVSVGQLRYIINAYPKAEGMILDIRGNGGGSLENVVHLLSIMPSNGQHLYDSQIRSGRGHDDFGPLQPTYAPIVSENSMFNKPVIVLVDKGCYSAASVFAICTQAYDNITLMGDTTSGGLGLPLTGVLPNGWQYRFPVTRTIALDGQNYENGVPPDVYLRLDKQMLHDEGRDNVIDSACARILSR